MKKLLVITALVGLILLILSACSSGGEQELADELHIYNWSEYIDPEVYDAFEAEYGVKVIEDTFSSNEELLAKIQAGAAGYGLSPFPVRPTMASVIFSLNRASLPAMPLAFWKWKMALSL